MTDRQFSKKIRTPVPTGNGLICRTPLAVALWLTIIFSGGIILRHAVTALFWGIFLFGRGAAPSTPRKNSKEKRAVEGASPYGRGFSVRITKRSGVTLVPASISRKALQSPRFYAIMSVANSINSYLEKLNKGIDILITERRWGRGIQHLFVRF